MLFRSGVWHRRWCASTGTLNWQRTAQGAVHCKARLQGFRKSQIRNSLCSKAHSLGKGHAFHQGHRREVDAVGHISDSPDVGHVGAAVLVHLQVIKETGMRKASYSLGRTASYKAALLKSTGPKKHIAFSHQVIFPPSPSQTVCQWYQSPSTSFSP